MVIVNTVLTAAVIWLAIAVSAAQDRAAVADQANTAHHSAFCQYLFTQEAVSAQHPALLPLVPGQLAGIRAEGC